LIELVEVSYLLAFIVFASLLFKFFQKWSDKKDKAHAESLEKSEGAWREFLAEQRTDFLKAIDKIS